MIRATESNQGRFAAETQELRAAARTVRDKIDDFSARSALKYRLDPGEVGHEGLGAELAAYQRSSAEAIDLLCADAQELATRLVDSASGYEELDADLADALSAALDRR